VRLGTWTNWSRGRVRGATLTLHERDGGLLIAFLALFVAAAGDSAWRVFCFALHRVLSRAQQQDGLYHQRQAILRNAASGTAGVLSLVRAAWAWRRNASKPFVRILPLASVGLIIALGFSTASIFASRVSTVAGHEVLLKGDSCGRVTTINRTSSDMTELLTGMLPYTIELLVSSSSYARRCYRNNSKPDDCPTFAARMLPTTIYPDAECPFQVKDICQSDSKNLLLDSGHINSHTHLGINAPPQHRFTFRQLTACAPLKTDAYSLLRNDSDNVFGAPYTEYYYGPPTTNQTNYTYAFPLKTPASSTNPNDYTLAHLAAYANGEGAAAFEPIADLHVPDADVSLYFLSANDVNYIQPVDDPWFAAHQLTSHQEDTVVGSDTPVWRRDEPATVLACTQQYQYCNPNLPESEGCTPLAGIDGWRNSASPDAIPMRNAAGEDIWRTSLQRAALRYVVDKAIYTTIADVVGSLNSGALLSRNSMWLGIQGPMGERQWQSEVEHWHRSSLAVLQRLMIEQATGGKLSDADISPWMTGPDGTAEWKRCKGQLVRSTQFASFSILGLIIIFVIGGFFVILSYLLDPLVVLLLRRQQGQRKPQASSSADSPSTTDSSSDDNFIDETIYKNLEWLSNETLQLQRLAHEQLGAGTWSGATGGNLVPVTEHGQLLARLDASNSRHPRLMVP
ncbi:uncharacterized protein K452DRAFT_204656, partial [Aplosporella prunicola CBS 121167]